MKGVGALTAPSSAPYRFSALYQSPLQVLSTLSKPPTGSQHFIKAPYRFSALYQSPLQVLSTLSKPPTGSQHFIKAPYRFSALYQHNTSALFPHTIYTRKIAALFPPDSHLPISAASLQTEVCPPNQLTYHKLGLPVTQLPHYRQRSAPQTS